MPDRLSKALPVLLPLSGSALLVAFTIASLRPIGGSLQRPRTPFDHSSASWVAPGYSLLQQAGAVIPAGASVVARTEPADPVKETWYHRLAVSLLPGRRILPSAFYGHFVSEEIWRDAEFLVLVGARPARPPGDLLLEVPEGSVWRRRNP